MSVMNSFSNQPRNRDSVNRGFFRVPESFDIVTPLPQCLCDLI